MLNQQEQMKLQEILQKKQKFIQKSIDAINKGNIELAVQNINIDSGLNIELINIIKEK